ALLQADEEVSGSPGVDHRVELARSHGHLGIALFQLGKRPEAETELRQALAVRQKLTADFPMDHLMRGELALTHSTLAALAEAEERWQSAEQELRKAVNLFETMAVEFPEDSDAHKNGAQCLLELGNL